MRAALLALAALSAAPAALAQGRGVVLQAQPPAAPFPGVPAGRRVGPAPNAFQPAPTPNRDYDAPAAPRAGNATEFKPGLFTRGETYRGDGFSRGSTSESDVQRRARPAPGFSLRMPLQHQ